MLLMLCSYLPPLDETNVRITVCQLYHLDINRQEPLALQLQPNSLTRVMIEIEIVILTTHCLNLLGFCLCSTSH